MLDFLADAVAAANHVDAVSGIAYLHAVKGEVAGGSSSFAIHCFYPGCCGRWHEDYFAEGPVVVFVEDDFLDFLLCLLGNAPGVELGVYRICAVVIEVIGHSAVAVVLECVAAERSLVANLTKVTLIRKRCRWRPSA